MANGFIYFNYYLLMKLKHREKFTWPAIIVAVLALACIPPALYHLGANEKNTHLTAAQSRQGNADCLWGDLFDAHDIWHFFSAGGLFFAFIFLLILDDGIAHMPRSKIPVF